MKVDLVIHPLKHADFHNVIDDLAQAEKANLVNGIAIQSYDPVACFKQKTR